MEAMEKLYSTAEIELATGLARGTITNRAKTLGYERNGFGYTVDQVLKILTAPLESHRKSEQDALELREKLNTRIKEERLPISIVERRNGKIGIEFRQEKAPAVGAAGAGQPEG